MSRRPKAKTAMVATVIGAASLTGAGFGIANAMTPTAPQNPTSVSVQHTDHADEQGAGDTPDVPGAVDKPEAGDTPDAPGQK